MKLLNPPDKYPHCICSPDPELVVQNLKLDLNPLTPVIHGVPLRAQRPLSALTAVKSAKAIRKSYGAKDPEQDSLSVWERDGESITERFTAPLTFRASGQQENEQLYTALH